MHNVLMRGGMTWMRWNGMEWEHGCDGMGWMGAWSRLEYSLRGLDSIGLDGMECNWIGLDGIGREGRCWFRHYVWRSCHVLFVNFCIAFF